MASIPKSAVAGKRATSNLHAVGSPYLKLGRMCRRASHDECRAYGWQFLIMCICSEFQKMTGDNPMSSKDFFDFFFNVDLSLSCIVHVTSMPAL
jgi:hypothetical protein